MFDFVWEVFFRLPPMTSKLEATTKNGFQILNLHLKMHRIKDFF